VGRRRRGAGAVCVRNGRRATPRAPHLPRFLDDATELEGRHFDLIFATEVLEHTPDPRAFLDSTRRHLSKAGCLLLTTPRAELVSHETDPGELYAVLSAGAHNFVLSTPALRELLREKFPEQQLWSAGLSHLAVVGERPIRLLPATSAAAHLRRYYAARASRPFGDARVQLSFSMHAYVWGVRCGAAHEVAHLTGGIDELLRGRFDLSLDEPLAIAARVATAGDIFAFGRAVPYSLPQYLAARAAHLRSAAPSAALEYETLAALVCLHGLRVNHQNLLLYSFLYRELFPKIFVRSLRHATPTVFLLFQQIAAVQAAIPELAGDEAGGWLGGRLARGIRRAARLVGKRGAIGSVAPLGLSARKLTS
jgi:SAM-dependent methyltransferase